MSYTMADFQPDYAKGISRPGRSDRQDRGAANLGGGFKMGAGPSEARFV